MDDIIRALYEGDLHACDRQAEPRREEERLTGLVADAEEELCGKLSAEQNELFEHFCEEKTRLNELYMYDRYRLGFLDGAGLMLDIFLSGDGKKNSEDR